MDEPAAQFVSMLKRIGCPQADTLNPASIEWLFENESIACWLEYLSASLHSSNMVSESELQMFKQLQANGETQILHGTELDNALSILNQSGQDMSEEELRHEIAVLESRVETLYQEKDCLIRERNRLSLQQSLLSDRYVKLESVNKAASLEYREAVSSVTVVSQQMNELLSELLDNALHLCNIYQSATEQYDKTAFIQNFKSAEHLKTNSNRGENHAQLKLDEYHQLEERYTQELTLLTKKLFFEGIAEVAGQNDGTRYEFLDVSNPDMLLIKGERNSVNLDDCKELARLQALYPKSELLRISAAVAEKSKAAACVYAENLSVSDRHLPDNLNELSSMLKERRAEQSNIQRELSSLSDRDLPHLVSESADAQATHILCGDFDLKIARQNYFISNQDKIINLLIIQRARNEMLTMLYEVELKGHRDVNRLLSAIRLLLARHLDEFKSRMIMMEDPSLAPSWQHRGTIDSRDHSTNRLYQILAADSEDAKSSQPWLLSYSKLTECADVASEHLSQLKASLSSEQAIQSNDLSSAESNLKVLQTLVYGGNIPSVNSRPSLSPQPVVEKLAQLDSVLQKLEQAVGDVIRDIEQKKLMLKSDSILAIERELFVYFFTDPERLRRVIDDVSTRVSAQQIK